MYPVNFLLKLAPYAKAVAAFIALLVPFLVSLGTVLNQLGSNTFQYSDIAPLAAAFVALVGGTHLVWRVPNDKVVPKVVDQINVEIDKQVAERKAANVTYPGSPQPVEGSEL